MPTINKIYPQLQMPEILSKNKATYMKQGNYTCIRTFLFHFLNKLERVALEVAINLMWLSSNILFL